MVDEGGFDPCECIFSYEAGMRRLISLLRNSQSYCTDTECFQEMPGPQGSSQTGDFGFLTITFLWIALAVILFLMRPSSLRGNRGNGKPSNQGPRGGSGQPPAPPIH